MENEDVVFKMMMLMNEFNEFGIFDVVISMLRVKEDIVKIVFG